jgi:putative signal transducing protein
VEQHSAEYRTVAVFGSLTDAELVRGMLEADGIAAAVLEGTDAALLPGVGRTIRVLVPAHDLPRAREILASPTVSPTDVEDDLVAPVPESGRSWTVGWMVLLIAAALVAAALL